MTLPRRKIVPPPPGTPPQRNGFLLLGALLLLITAIVPPEAACLLAFFNGILLWGTFTVRMGRSMSRGAEGAQKLFFGCLGMVLAAISAVLLVGLSCAVPMSRMSFH